MVAKIPPLEKVRKPSPKNSASNIILMYFEPNRFNLITWAINSTAIPSPNIVDTWFGPYPPLVAESEYGRKIYVSKKGNISNIDEIVSTTEARSRGVNVASDSPIVATPPIYMPNQGRLKS